MGYTVSSRFYSEPTFTCPKCGLELHTEWVDNGFGPFAVQASPYVCEECGWVEGGCPANECSEQCFSWIKCRGRSILNNN